MPSTSLHTNNEQTESLVEQPRQATYLSEQQLVQLSIDQSIDNALQALLDRMAPGHILRETFSRYIVSHSFHSFKLSERQKADTAILKIYIHDLMVSPNHNRVSPELSQAVHQRLSHCSSTTKIAHYALGTIAFIGVWGLAIASGIFFGALIVGSSIAMLVSGTTALSSGLGAGLAGIGLFQLKELGLNETVSHASHLERLLNPRTSSRAFIQT